MGGVKKKTITQAEKAQFLETKRGEKKSRESDRFGQQSARRNILLMPRLDDNQISKIFGNMKAITIYSTAKTLEVNASVASSLLKNLEARKIIVKVGGYSGHYVYRLADIA